MPSAYPSRSSTSRTVRARASGVNGFWSSTIPAVALTAAIATDVGRLVAAGCNGYIPKPLVPGTFLPLIRQFLRASVARAPGPRQ